VTSSAASRWSTRETIAGLLATFGIFLAAMELFYRPFRLAPAAVILLLIATVMSNTQQRLVRLGFAVLGVCFVVGATVQVLTHHPLY
jgi:hypothetical protein